MSINDEPTDTSVESDVQCFDYDHLRRLTQAWTPGATGEEACAAEPEVNELGGAAPYWHEFTYDAIGNRVQEVQHGPGGGITRDYTGPEDEQDPAHAVTQVDETGSAGNTTHSYAYDDAGNMVSRDSGDQDQTLEWGPEGKLVKVTGGLSSTEYVYDADGERLLRRANGATTLYLPGMEVTWDPAEGTEEATRYFSHAGETVAVRENDGSLSWVMSDHHGTGQIAVDADFSEVSQRRMTVFGQDRGTTGTWPGERGFVDGMIDASTGLTQLGARSYDADLGRFISVDPLMDLADLQQMHGYAYANSNPASFSDSSGLLLIGDHGGGAAANKPRPMSWQEEKWLWNQQYVHQNNPKILKRNTAKFHKTTGGIFRPKFSGGRPHVSRSAEPPKVSATVSPEEQSLWDSAWNGFSNSASNAWGWTKENWGTISQVAGWVGFGACVVVSAGSCLAIGGAVLAANVGMDYAVNGSINWKEHGWSALMLGMGGGAALGVGRLASGTWRGALSSMGSRPTVRAGAQKWDYNPKSGNPQRREGIFQGWGMNSGPVDWGASSAGYAINIASGSTFGGPEPYSNPFSRD